MFSFFKGISKLTKALSRTSAKLTYRLRSLLGKAITEESLAEIEQLLFEADLGCTLSVDFTEKVRLWAKKEHSAEELLEFLKEESVHILSKKPNVSSPEGVFRLTLVLGVNGSGKTTSCAKLASLFRKEGRGVILAAGDTFRAAAVEQLSLWGERLGIRVVKSKSGADPSGVVFDAITSAASQGISDVIADTAGRLQSKTDLMHELAKILKVAKKASSEIVIDTFLVIDATTGQNGLDQVKIFNNFTPLTGIIVTKLDGSAKGGILLSIYHETGIPIRYVGIGEGVDDLIPFDPKEYVDGLFG